MFSSGFSCFYSLSGVARALQDSDVSLRKQWSSNLQELQVKAPNIFFSILKYFSILGCGAYGYDINQLCAAWTEAPEEMTKEQYQVEQHSVGLSWTYILFLGMEVNPGNRNELKEKYNTTVIESQGS